MTSKELKFEFKQFFHSYVTQLDINIFILRELLSGGMDVVGRYFLSFLFLPDPVVKIILAVLSLGHFSDVGRL